MSEHVEKQKFNYLFMPYEPCLDQRNRHLKPDKRVDIHKYDKIWAEVKAYWDKIEKSSSQAIEEE